MSNGASNATPISIKDAIQTARDMAGDSVDAATAITKLGLVPDSEEDSESKKLTAAICKMTAEVRKLYNLGGGNLQHSMDDLKKDMEHWKKTWSHGIPKVPPDPKLLNPVLPSYVYPPNCEHKNG